MLYNSSSLFSFIPFCREKKQIFLIQVKVCVTCSLSNPPFFSHLLLWPTRRHILKTALGKRTRNILSLFVFSRSHCDKQMQEAGIYGTIRTRRPRCNWQLLLDSMGHFSTCSHFTWMLALKKGTNTGKACGDPHWWIIHGSLITWWEKDSLSPQQLGGSLEMIGLGGLKSACWRVMRQCSH